MNLSRMTYVCVLAVAAIANPGVPPPVPDARGTDARQSYGTLPLAFEPLPEIGADGPIYISRGPGFSVSVSRRETVLAFPKSSSEPRDADVVRVRFAGAATASAIEAIDQLPGRVNYLIGNDPRGWRTGVPTFATIRAVEVFPGVDYLLHGAGGQLEYDFVVSPGADPAVIALEFDGAEIDRLTDSGALELRTPGGVLRQSAPVIYQDTPAGRVVRAGRYELRDNDFIGFAIDDYDTSLPLVIDPVISYSTYLGSAGVSLTHAVAVDNDGNAYLTGYGDSTYPVVGGLPASYGRPGPGDAWSISITKLNPTGTSFIYSTFVGGTSSNERGWDITVDDSGAVHVTGSTFSHDFPTVNPYQATHNSTSSNGFVFKLSPAGDSLVFSTYIGGNSDDHAHGIATDPSGNVYVTGLTTSAVFPTLNPLQGTLKGSHDAFVLKLTSAGAGVYATYLGGTNMEQAFDIVADASGNAYFVGFTLSTDFPLVTPFQTAQSHTDAFVTKINANGSAILYSTLFGGSAVGGGFGEDRATGIALGPAGNIFIVGLTSSANLPIVNGFQPKRGGTGSDYDLFVAKFNPAGSALDYSTFLGGFYSEFVGYNHRIAVDCRGRAVVVGGTRSADFPLVNAWQATASGSGTNKTAPVITKLHYAGNQAVYSSYTGGNNLLGFGGLGISVAFDRFGDAILTGYVDGNLVTTPGVVQPTQVGGRSGFVQRIEEKSVNDPAMPCNLVTNGTFGDGVTQWTTFALPDMSYIVANVTNGVMEFYRQPAPAGVPNQAVVFHDSRIPLAAATPLLARFDIGNSSSVRKRISVLVHDSSFADQSVCTFWLEPGAPLRTYEIRTHTTQAWANATLSFYAASVGSDGGAYRLDNVSLYVMPGQPVNETLCVDPTTPSPVAGAPSGDLLVNGDFGSGSLAPGWNTFGQIQGQVSGFVFEFIKLPGTPAGVLFQNTAQPTPAQQVLTATFQLGNSSSVRKRVTVLLHDIDFSDLFACTFWLAPGAALDTFTVRGWATRSWTQTTLSIYPATVGSEQWIRLDNVSLQRTPAVPIPGTMCIEPAGTPQFLPNVTWATSRAGQTDGAAIGDGTASNDTRPSGRLPRPSTDWIADGFVSDAGDRPGVASSWMAVATDASHRTLTSARAFLVPADGAAIGFESWLSGLDVRAMVRVSVDGVNWQTLQMIEKSDGWMPVLLDLEAWRGEAVQLQFLFEGSPARQLDHGHEFWRIRFTPTARPRSDPHASHAMPDRGTPAPMPGEGPRSR